VKGPNYRKLEAIKKMYAGLSPAEQTAKYRTKRGKKVRAVKVLKSYRDRPRFTRLECLRKDGSVVYGRYMKSQHWFDRKRRLFAVRGKRCECCGSVREIHVHHLHYRTLFEERDEDLKVLCRLCHGIAHKG
jgi:5-methylcytosine-specific restriction endonuclease McrA